VPPYKIDTSVEKIISAALNSFKFAGIK